MYKKILVAIDGSDVADHAFESALQFAKTENAELFVLHIIESPQFYLPEVGIDPASIYEALVAEGGHITQHARDRLKNEGVRGQAGVLDNFLSGHATVDQIQHMAEEFHADLIVLGTHGRSGFKRLMLGSVAEAFVRMSTRPVLLIPQRSAVESSMSA
ncbi:universal stress protein [Alcaligenaceae bacterium CGII-47]|nr:universal stress protein [Alcaligenaceae bacterium CGII-47]